MIFLVFVTEVLVEVEKCLTGMVIVIVRGVGTTEIVKIVGTGNFEIFL